MPDVRISQRVLIGLVLGGYGVVLVVQIVSAVVDPSLGGLGALILLVVVGAFGALIGLMIHYGRASQRRLAAAIFDSGSAAPPWGEPWALVVLTPLPLPRWASAGALDPGPAARRADGRRLALPPRPAAHLPGAPLRTVERL